MRTITNFFEKKTIKIVVQLPNNYFDNSTTKLISISKNYFYNYTKIVIVKVKESNSKTKNQIYRFCNFNINLLFSSSKSRFCNVFARKLNNLKSINNLIKVKKAQKTKTCLTKNKNKKNIVDSYSKLDNKKLKSKNNKNNKKKSENNKNASNSRDNKSFFENKAK